MAPRQNPTINRAGTGATQASSLRRQTTNFLTQAQKKSSPVKPPEHQGTYPVYACPWEKLKAWLERTFPDHRGTFEEWINGDHYIFKIPRPLTETEGVDARMNIPLNFVHSYNRYESYPCHPVYKSSSSFALDSYKTRLNEIEPKLCMSNDADTNVRILDSPLAGVQDFTEETIIGDPALKAYLGDQSTIGPVATKKDPKCRFIYFWAAHSQARLKTTRKMLVRTLTYHQVMPGYLNFVSVFGQQTKPHNARFSGFREQTVLSTPLQGQAIHDLGRSGRQFQLCYNLKSVSRTSPEATVTVTKIEKKFWRWSTRQVALCHQFDTVEGTTLWILTKGGLDLKERIQEMTGSNGRREDRTFGTPQECFQSSLAVHLLLAHWANEGWRWYIQWLEDVIEEETHPAVVGPRGPDDAPKFYVPKDLQIVQQFEEKSLEAIMVLETNIDVLEALSKYYQSLLSNSDFVMRTDCAGAVHAFASQINDTVYDLKMQNSRVKLLVRITSERKSLVLQHLQTQATEKIETLTVNMQNIGVLAQKEAIAVRIITVLTLVYLPATFVSTFFSTDVVKYQNQGNSQGGQGSLSSFSQLALHRWLQVTLPLTFLTLVLAWLGYRWAERRQHDKLALYALELKTV